MRRNPSTPGPAIAGLASAQLAEVLGAAELLLETSGVRVAHDGLRARCGAAGAIVDDATGAVRFPRALLADLLAQAPSTFPIARLDGTVHCVGGGTQGCIGITNDPWILDAGGGAPRRPTLADVRRHTIVQQAIPDVVAVSCMDFPVSDVPGPLSSLTALRDHLLNHDRHTMAYAASPEGFRRAMDLGRLRAQGSQECLGLTMSAAVAVVSPMTITGINADFLLECCAEGVPIIPTICPMAGATSPYSVAATLLQAHAECIALIAVAQAVRPGHPCLYGVGPSITDLRTGRDLYYPIDKVMWKLGAAQLGGHYGLPVFTEAGGSMTWQADLQCGAEGMLFMQAASSTGCALLSGIGSGWNGMAMSAELALVQMEWLSIARCLAGGIRTDDGRLAASRIEAAGFGGSFLMDDLTLRYVRGGEFYRSQMLDPVEEGAPPRGILERARDRVEALVASHVSPVDGEVREATMRYFRDACGLAD